MTEWKGFESISSTPKSSGLSSGWDSSSELTGNSRGVMRSRFSSDLVSKPPTLPKFSMKSGSPKTKNNLNAIFPHARLAMFCHHNDYSPVMPAEWAQIINDLHEKLGEGEMHEKGIQLVFSSLDAGLMVDKSPHQQYIHRFEESCWGNGTQFIRVPTARRS